jgi:flagellar hook-associated protein 2
MSTTSTTYFDGQSTYATQLNNVIAHAVAVATLPITQLQDEQSTLTNQQSEVQTLGSDFEAVQSAIDSLNTALISGSYSATVGTPSVATATVSAGAQAGTYSLDVTNIGAQTNTLSAAGSPPVTDPTTGNISSSTAFTLTVDGTQYSLTPSGTSLDDLVQAINASGANVQATVVNVGGSTSPDYRLSVQGTQYADDTIQLNDGTNNLLTALDPPGANVTYTVNGSTTPATSTSRTLTLSTGLTATVSATGTTSITVAEDSSGITSALSSFVSAYNAATTELTNNRGQGTGALTGDPLVSELQSALDSVANYVSSSSSSVNALTDLGVTFNTTGQLEFSQSTFDSASLEDVTNFLGSETNGGFIGTAYSTLTGLTDSTSGVITEAGNNIGTSITNLATEITSKQAQVSQLQNNLTTQMAQADSALSALQSQLSQITDLFAAETLQSQDINNNG